MPPPSPNLNAGEVLQGGAGAAEAKPPSEGARAETSTSVNVPSTEVKNDLILVISDNVKYDIFLKQAADEDPFQGEKGESEVPHVLRVDQ